MRTLNPHCSIILWSQSFGFSIENTQLSPTPTSLHPDLKKPYPPPSLVNPYSPSSLTCAPHSMNQREHWTHLAPKIWKLENSMKSSEIWYPWPQHPWRLAYKIWSKSMHYWLRYRRFTETLRFRFHSEFQIWKRVICAVLCWKSNEPPSEDWVALTRYILTQYTWNLNADILLSISIF